MLFFFVIIMCTAEIDSICYYWSIHYQAAGTEFVDCLLDRNGCMGGVFVLCWKGRLFHFHFIYTYITWETWSLACYAKSGLRSVGRVCRSSLTLGRLECI